MKKGVLMLMAILLYTLQGFAALTGTKTIGVDYVSLAQAIADLNTQGVGPGGVTFNVPANWTETFANPTDGYITATGTPANPIVFQKSGVGSNPVITASTGTSTMDAIIAILGGDYITMNGINLMENGANTTATTQMEWGYALLKASPNDGCQSVTISNCSINLAASNVATVGIYGANHTSTSNTQITLTASTGSNSNLKIYSNTILAYTSIQLNGFNDPNFPYAYYDQNNEIGKNGGNTITKVAGLANAGYGIYTTYQNNVVVANNNITSSGGAAGTTYGIYLTNANNGSYELYNNTVSIQFTGTGTANLYAIYCDMGANGVSNTSNIYNNTVTNCSFSTMTTGFAYMIYLSNLGVNTQVYNNQITNNSCGSSSVTATGRFYTLTCTKGGTMLGPYEIHDNVITGNTRTQSVSGGGLTYYLNIGGTCSVMNVYNNTISNNTVASNGGTYLFYTTVTGTKYVYNNTITNISKCEGSTYGLYNGAFGGVGYFYKNKVQNLEGLTSTSAIYGIYISASGTTNYFYNNQVSDLRSLAGNNANTSLVGVYASAGNPIGFYNNTVYLNGTSTGTNFGTAAFYASTSAGVDLRNNILVNTSTPNGTGKTVAMRFSGAGFTNFALTTNYNDLYAGTPGVNNLIFFDGTASDQTLANYKTRVTPRESQSVTELPPFVNTSVGNMNMHIQTATATQCESGGTTISTPVNVTADFDNVARYPNTGYPVGGFTPHAPDLGAFEFGGLSADFIAPGITYTPLPNASNGNARTLYATITDGSGVPTSGIGLPVLYWRINNTGTYQSAQGAYVSGSTYSFTFGAGAAMNDQVNYFIAAQDMASTPNVGTSPIGGSGFTANPPACSSAPLINSSYYVYAGISGVFHVGTGKNYNTLTEAIFDINGKVISGPVTLLLDDPIYSGETFPIILTPNAGSSAQNTLTIKPNTGNSAVFTTNINNSLLIVNGFTNLIMDGSNNGTNSQNLLFENVNSTTAGNVIQFASYNSTVPASNVVVKNCVIQMVPVHASGGNIAIRFSNVGGGYSDISITNNTIKSVFTGIQLNSASANIARRILIANNVLGSMSDADALTRDAIFIQYADSTLVLNNEMMGPLSGSYNTGQTGVYIGAGSTNTKIRSNKIHGFSRFSDDGWGVTGIWYASDNSTVTEISNNQIYDIHSPGVNAGVGQNITYGIFVRSGGNLKIDHNTINLFGAYMSPVTSYDASSACIAFYYQANGGNIEVKNNIFRNGSTTLGGGASGYGKAYAIMVSIPAQGFSTINNNDYFTDGSNGMVGQYYQNGTGFIIEFPTLASWQSFTGQESNSLYKDPVFVSNTNLLPTTTTMPHAGSYIPTIPTDYNGTLRTNPPDVGALEFTQNPLITTTAATSVGVTTAQINGTANAQGTLFNLNFDYGLTTAYGASTAAVPPSTTGSTQINMLSGLTSLAPLTTYHYRARGVTSGGLTVYGNDMTFTTLPSPPSVVTTNATAITANSATLNGSVNANGGSSTVTFEWGLTTAYGNTLAATPGSVSGSSANLVSANISGLQPYTLYHFRAVAVNQGGTTYGNDMTFTSLPVLSAVVTNLATGVTSSGAQLNGTVTAFNAPTTVTFEYGLTTSYGSVVNSTPGTVTGASATAVLASLSGLAINTTYHFRCVGVNAAGTTYGNDMTFTTNCVAPVITITGPATTCSGVAGNVYTTQTGNTNYQWTVSAGGTITSGAGTNSITVTWNTAGAQTVSVNYTNTFGCNATAPFSYNVTVNASPTPTITGSASVCAATTGNVYTTQAGMTGYTWTISAGGTITTGAGTNSITVSWNTVGAQTVSVNYSNASGCAALVATVYNVTVNARPNPTITGQNSLCVNSGYYNYSTEAGMTNYTWTVSAGGTITFGQGTNNLQVTWNTAGAQTVTVNYNNGNGCNATTPSSMNVTVNPLPGNAGNITGTATVCGGATGITYSVGPVPNASYYVWTLPVGATIASGAGTNVITVDFAANASSGTIVVVPNNACGNGNASPAFAVTVNASVAAAGTITGQAEVCQGTSGVVYSVAQIANATSYTWTVPTGATIVSGNNTNSITVNFAMNAQSGNISVVGSNSCGSGAPSPNFPVTVNAIPDAPVITVNGDLLTSSASVGNQWYFEGAPIAGATSQTYTATATGSYWSVVTINGCSSDSSNHIYVVVTGLNEVSANGLTLYPVPNDGRFTVEFESTKNQKVDLTIYNNIGQVIYSERNIEVTGTFTKAMNIQPIAPGVYSVFVGTKSGNMIRKMIVR